MSILTILVILSAACHAPGGAPPRMKMWWHAATLWEVMAGRRSTFAGAVAHSILVITSHRLVDPAVDFHELGPDFFDRRDTDATRRRLVERLEHLGFDVALTQRVA